METNKLRVEATGLIGGLLFFAVVCLGCGYIVFSKLSTFGAFYVTMVPVLIMLAYAILLGLTRLFRLRDDQSGDNLYYMGFLFTLTSLAASLYQFTTSGSVEQIVQNFGIAIASTIAGIALRIFFNQMRRDPIEVEHMSRLDLAQASRKVKRELEGTVLEFAYFRRATQQSISDALDEVVEVLKGAKEHFVLELKDFAKSSSEPIEYASKKSTETLESFHARLAQMCEHAANQIGDVSRQLSQSATSLAESIDGMGAKLRTMQTPDKVIEIKLNPMVQGLSRTVNSFSKNAEAHTEAIDNNTKQAETLSSAIMALVSEMKTAHTAAIAGLGLDSASPSSSIDTHSSQPPSSTIVTGHARS
jgi:hypothetical protein